MSANTVTTVTQISPRRDIDPRRRSANKFLAIRFINDDLVNRAGLDIRRSVILYDADHLFMVALPYLPDALVLQRLFDEAGVRHWSKGV
jgi:hypothetical protein